MAKSKTFIPDDVCEDVVLVKVVVERFPQLIININRNTGELISELRDKGNLSDKVSLKVLLDNHGKSIYPQNLYLHYLISKKGLKNADTDAQALLAYTRWLSICGYKYDDLTANPSEGVVWKFSDFLIHNLRQIEHSGKVINPDGFALSTAKIYLSSVINFYKWMHYEALLPFSSARKPFMILSGTHKNRGSDNHMLSHTWKGSSYTFQTTDIMKRFPKIQTTESYKKLKPMTKGDLLIFNEALSQCDPVFRLIFRLMLEVGLRISEVASFPESIDAPTLPLTKFTIGPVNGVHTKFDKIREVSIPDHLFNPLHVYLFSKKRRLNLKRKGVKIDRYGYSNSDHGRLFVNELGTPYDSKTIQREWIKLRDYIRINHPNWYYRAHDTRSTFATYWLATEQKRRNVTYNYLLDELADLLGHNDPSTTMKYVQFLEKQDVWIDHSLDKNDRVTLAIHKEGM